MASLITHRLLPNKANDDVTIYEGRIDMQVEKNIIECTGTVKFKWLPRIRIEARLFYDQEKYNTVFSADIITVTLGESDTKLPFRKTRSSAGDCLGVIPVVKEGNIHSDIDSITFVLPNLMEFRCNGHLLKFVTSSFTVEFEHHPPASGYSPVDGGFVLHGRGSVKFKKSVKGIKDCVDVLDMISVFLTFIHARKISPLFILGYHGNDNLFKYFPIGDVDENTLPWGWHNISIYSSDYEPLRNLFNTLYEYYQNDDDKDCIKLIVHWYNEAMANRSGIEASLMLIQNALELLTSRILVERERIVDNADYEKISATTLINILLNHTGIENSIPELFGELVQFAKANNLTTGPSVITYIRNCIVHPHLKNRKKFKKLTPTLKYQAFQLALHYVEIVTLKYLGYTGKYYNRCLNANYINSLTMVPWHQVK